MSHTHACIHSLTHSHTHTHTSCTHAHTRTHHAHMMHTHTHINIHTHMHTHTHARMHIHAHTHTHTQNMESNWKNGHHTLTRIECHSENSKGVYCLQYDSDKIVSGLRDNTIKVLIVFCVGASKAPPSSAVFVIQHQKAVPLFLAIPFMHLHIQ